MKDCARISLLFGSLAVAATLFECSSFDAAETAPGATGPDAANPSTSDAQGTAPVDLGEAGDCVGAYRNAVLADGAYAYWRMNTTNGNVLRDETENHNDLTLLGGYQLNVKGALGCDPDPAIHFDGADAHASASDALSRNLDFGSKEPFSIEVWVQREETTSTASFFHVIDDKQGQGTKAGYLLYYNKLIDRMVFEYDWDGGAQAVEATIAANTYVYYVTTFDGTTLEMYANGERADSASPVEAMGPRDQPFFIAREDEIGNHNFPGAIDEVAIYKRRLSPDQITTHYRLATQTK